ncbi:hypothetical protein GGR56DRAFT_39015 [Xylariaceae sp. FL0804]|nr:hypothetical protein GGR56DRAFT_39015 [Xylariaceae sp. FL0804]
MTVSAVFLYPRLPRPNSCLLLARRGLAVGSVLGAVGRRSDTDTYLCLALYCYNLCLYWEAESQSPPMRQGLRYLKYVLPCYRLTPRCVSHLTSPHIPAHYPASHLHVLPNPAQPIPSRASAPTRCCDRRSTSGLITGGGPCKFSIGLLSLHAAAPAISRRPIRATTHD